MKGLKPIRHVHVSHFLPNLHVPTKIGISILYGGRLEPTFFYNYATAFSSNMNVIYYILPGCKPVVTSCPGSLQSFILCFIKDVIFSRGNSVIHLPHVK